MTTGQNIADEVRTQLNDGDTSNYRWSDAELLSYINAAQRQIVLIVPEANIVQENVTPAAASSARQVLPASGVKFVRVANYDASASLPGPAITAIERDAIESAFPQWLHESTYGTDINNPSVEDEYTDMRFRHYHHDPREPKTYFLYPAQNVAADMEVLLTYAKLPTALGSLAGTFALGDEYLNAAVDYVTYRALMKDGRHGTDPANREALWNNFLRSLGIKVQSDKRVDPGTIRPPMDDHG